MAENSRHPKCSLLQILLKTQHLREDLSFSRHSHCKWHKGQEPLSLHYHPSPPKLEAMLVDVPFQCLMETSTPHHRQHNEFQSPVNSQTEKGYWTKLPNYWNFDKKQKNCLPDKACSQVLNFINNSLRFKEQLLFMYGWQGPWFEPRNHRVFCSPCWGVGVWWDPLSVVLQGFSWPLRSFSGTDSISVSCGHCLVI